MYSTSDSQSQRSNLSEPAVSGRAPRGCFDFTTDSQSQPSNLLSHKLTEVESIKISNTINCISAAPAPVLLPGSAADISLFDNGNNSLHGFARVIAVHVPGQFNTSFSGALQACGDNIIDLVHALTHTCTHLLTHTCIHSLMHSLTHSLTHLHICHPHIHHLTFTHSPPPPARRCTTLKAKNRSIHCPLVGLGTQDLPPPRTCGGRACSRSSASAPYSHGGYLDAKMGTSIRSQDAITIHEPNLFRLPRVAGEHERART